MPCHHWQWVSLPRARRGHQVHFYDDKAEAIPDELDVDLLALSVETFTARRAYQLADRFRQQGIKVVMGGYHPTFLPKEALQHADAVVTGDAEGTWEQLLADAERDRMQSVYQGNNRNSLKDMRDRSLDLRGQAVCTDRAHPSGCGCRFICDFCSIHEFYGTTVMNSPGGSTAGRTRSAEQPPPAVFVDDNLFSTAENLDSLLRIMTPLGRRWSCQISIDVARDPALLDRLAAAGCRYVLIGFESLEAENLRQMNKPWNRVAGDYRQVVAGLHSRGIGVYGTFVFGYDYDTPDSIRDV